MSKALELDLGLVLANFSVDPSQDQVFWIQ
jgi:hypothetical protein